MTRPGRIVGRCYRCGFPVLSQEAVRVKDLAVSDLEDRPVRRLAHKGECAKELEHRIGRGAR